MMFSAAHQSLFLLEHHWPDRRPCAITLRGRQDVWSILIPG
jgi:hypothetical protein